MSEQKRAQVELKGAEGAFIVRFATKRDAGGELVIDHDGDVYADGAIGAQDVVIGCWNHGTCEGPAGTAKTFETTADIRAEGRLLVETRAGAEEYARWKALGASAEFSYVFQVLDADEVVVRGRRVRRLKALDVISVDLVARGAGINTGIVALKGGCGCPETDWRDELRREKRRFEAFEASRDLVGLKAQALGLIDPYPAVECKAVPFLVREAAAVGARLAAEWLGLQEAPPVRFFKCRPEMGGRPQRLGYNRLGEGVAWVSVDISPREALEVAAHEVGHIGMNAETHEQVYEFSSAVARFALERNAVSL